MFATDDQLVGCSPVFMTVAIYINRLCAVTVYSTLAYIIHAKWGSVYIGGHASQYSRHVKNFISQFAGVQQRLQDLHTSRIHDLDNTE